MKSLVKYLSFLALGALVASCADDGLADKGTVMPEPDTPYFVNLRLVTETGNFTRAVQEADAEPEKESETGSGLGKLVDGSYDEHEISPNAHNFALFFDANKNYISYANLYSVNEPGVGSGKDHNDPGYDHGAKNPDENGVPVEATFSCRFYGFANRKPKYVLVVANANDKIYDQITNFPGWNIDAVMKQVWEEKGRLEIETDRKTGEITYKYTEDPYESLGFCKIEEDGETKKYFTMTNSSYIKDEKLYCAEEIPDDCIATSEEELEKLKEANKSVKIYLERMVSKFNMELSFDASSYQPTEKRALDVCVYNNDGTFTYYDCPWAIDILGWGLNGLETKNYIFKNIETEGDWLIHPGWNSIAERRSYWTRDPHYDDRDNYPWQFDEAKNIYDLDPDHEGWYDKFLSYDNEDKKDQFSLIYYPLTQFCKDIDEKTGKLPETFSYTGATDIYYYTPENSFQPGMQVDPTRGTRAYELAGTHILVAARLRVANSIVPDENGNIGTDGAIEPFNGNIYRNRVGVTYLDEVSMFEDFMNAVNYKMESQKYIYYKYYPWNDEQVKKEEKYYGRTLRVESSGVFALYYLDEAKNKYYELTSSILRDLDNSPNYRLYREADAVNADGKVIPWVMYDDGQGQGFQPLRLFLLNKGESSNPGKYHEGTYDPSQGEIIAFNPNNKKEVENYVESRRLTIKRLVEDKPTKSWEEIPAPNFRDDNDIQSIFYEVYGLVDCYNHGLMYYAIPIHAQESNGTPAVGADRPPYSGSPTEFNDLSLAYYYGVVRNNWYKFTLHSIGDLGVPVENPAKPIVPNYNSKKDQVKVEMEIIPMHIEDITVPMP